MDVEEIETWLARYAAAFAALGRGDLSPADVGGAYAVPLLLTTDDVVLSLTTEAEVAAWLRSQADGMVASAYHHTETLEGEVVVLNRTAATYRAVLSRRRTDGSEISRMTVTYLITRQGDGPRVSALVVHSPE